MVCMLSSDAFEDALKLKFVKESMRKEYSFRKQVKLGKDLHTAIDWIATKSAKEVMCCGVWFCMSLGIMFVCR